MTDNEGDPGLIFNLDCIPSPIAAIVLRAIAETPDGPVWITEGGKRKAAIVPVEWAETAKAIIASAWQRQDKETGWEARGASADPEAGRT